MFKNFKIQVLILSWLLPVLVKAQNCGVNYLGTKALYATPAGKITAPPAGYQPVFINYVGRHGARHLTKEVNTSYAYKMLAAADSANMLTPGGRQLRKMVVTLDKVEHSQVKSISVEGKDELQGIGRRLFKNYPQVFTGEVKLNVGITKEVRTKQSAEAFLTGLKAGFKDSALIKNYTDDTNLRFFDASPAYTAFEESGNWQTVMQQLQQKLNTNAINKGILQKWFNSTYLKTLKPTEIDKLVSDVFGFATIVASLKTEVAKAGFKPTDVDFAALFTCAELSALSKVDVAEDYLKKAPGTAINGIQVRVAVPLLVNFINTTDAFIKANPYNAELRFAHAETISPFATLLGLDKANKIAKDITKLDAAWKSSEVIPLSANIQWVFYKKKGSNDLLVKMLLNEQEAHISGLATATFPFYKWPALRAFYIAKLAKLNVKLDDDMEKFLKEVK